MHQQIIEALASNDISAKLWEKGSRRRLYLARGEGRKRQEIGFLELDEEGRVTQNCATHRTAGIRDIVAAAGGRA